MNNFIRFSDIDPNTITDKWNEMIREVVSSYFLPPRKRKVCVDIGSNIGAFMGYALNEDRFESICGFEPAFQTYHTSLSMLKHFDLVTENVQLRNLAVSYKTGDMLRLFEHPSSQSGDTSLIEPDEVGQHEVCLSVSLDDIFELLNVDYIDYLKMDCEGAELGILLASERLHDIGIIIMETHEVNGSQTKGPIRELFSKIGFWTMGFRHPQTGETNEIIIAVNTLKEDVSEFPDYYGYGADGQKNTLGELEAESIELGGAPLNIKEWAQWFKDNMREAKNSGEKE